MGTYDISRINFDARKHYIGVRMQQGRVLTDDDWNENDRIQMEDERRSRVDIIGPFGSGDEGFRIEKIPALAGLNDGGLINFLIKAGTLYLGGLRLELGENETYRLQKDWLQQPAGLDKVPAFDGTEHFDLVYIEAWQQAVCAVEDESLFEVALGGPDTTTRLRSMRRVHIASGLGYCDCADAWHQLMTNWQLEKLGKVNQQFERVPDSRLTVSFADAGLPEDLCTPHAAGGYLGAENQAIRVQIVDSGNFTWGFDNASPLYRVTVSADGKTVKMLTEPKDQYHWPLAGQVVEILPWSAVLPNGEKIAEQLGHLSRVEASYKPVPGEFTLAEAVAPTFGTDWKSRSDKDNLEDQQRSEYFYLRAWNRGNDLESDPKISFTPGTPVTLGHSGIQVTITGNDIVAADYWVIAARPETPNRVVPWELEQGIAPHGVRRFFAPLAVIRWTNINQQVSGEIIHDCRKRFNPLTEQDCCCTYTVGDGIRSKGDFSSIQEAINNLPGQGGKICVLPGEHIANVGILKRRQIRISGCGDHSIVRPGPNQLTTPVFLIGNSQGIQIDQLCIVALDGIGIEVRDTKDVRTASEKITISENRILAGIHAIKIQTRDDLGGNNSIDILYNQLGIIDKLAGKAAIFSIADDVLIERNRIVVVPARDPNDRDDPRDEDDPNDGDPFDPCRDPRVPYTRGYSLGYQVYLLLKYVKLYLPSGRYIKGYAAMGGIQVGATSEGVRILENEIIGGKGNGITLGHLDEVVDNPTFTNRFSVRNIPYSYSGLYDIHIQNNHVLQMGLSGISAFLNFVREQHIVHVEGLTIYRNTITYCARQIPGDIPANAIGYWAFGGIILSDCENGSIRENRVENNGRTPGEPICGVFVLQGEKMDISANNIVNNGMAMNDGNPVNRPGNRGGIVIKMSFKTPEFKKLINATIPSFDGVPAVRVHDNIVSQPLGHALFLMAFGPVSVVSNQFTSFATDRSNRLSFFAASVYIFNLGFSKDVLATAFRNMANTNPAAYQNLLLNPGFLQLFRALQFLPSGKIMFSDNQTTLDLRSPAGNLGVSSQLIVSMDDVAFNNNQSECAAFLSLPADTPADIILFNTILFGASIRSNDNRFLDGFTRTLYSLISYGFMNTAVGNQASNCLIVLGAMRAINNNIILHYSLCNDQKQKINTALAVPAGIDF